MILCRILNRLKRSFSRYMRLHWAERWQWNKWRMRGQSFTWEIPEACFRSEWEKTREGNRLNILEIVYFICLLITHFFKLHFWFVSKCRHVWTLVLWHTSSDQSIRSPYLLSHLTGPTHVLFGFETWSCNTGHAPTTPTFGAQTVKHVVDWKNDGKAEG